MTGPAPEVPTTQATTAPRRVIQIAAVPSVLFAVGDDGTLWRMMDAEEVTTGAWVQLPSLPGRYVAP